MFMDTSGDHLLHFDSCSLSSELQNMSRHESVEPEPVPDSEDLLQFDSTSAHLQTHPVMKLNPNLKDNWTMPTFHQQMVSANNMTMNCSYCKRRLMHHLTISVIRKVMLVKS